MMKDNDFMDNKPLAVYMAPTKVSNTRTGINGTSKLNQAGSLCGAI